MPNTKLEKMNNDTVIAKSPGRINIIGEHTDYNDGFVLPAAIDKYAVFKLWKSSNKNKVRMTATNLDESISFNLSHFQPTTGGWPNYIMGVVHELQKLGVKLEGFEGEFESDVPIGGGMSSSAALECSLAYGLNELFNLGLDRWELIKACQMAEHNFVGIKCGIMDQFASVMGKDNQVMLLDCRSLEFDYFPFELGNYQLLLLNTNVSHTLAASEYNTRRAECEVGVSIIRNTYSQVQSLRDVTTEMLDKCSEYMPHEVHKRCLHIISENSRTREACQALLKQDYKKLGELIYGSHNSLQHYYEVSCEELDYLVEQTRDKDYVLGSRMMGGGFGGCTINLIAKDKVNQFIEISSKAYRNRFGIDITPYKVQVRNGAELAN